ncbi:MAG: hypothetical protein V4683_04240 [Bacteroidota bacterium]
MLRLSKLSILSILFIFVAFSCKKEDDLTTMADFLSRDDSDPKILREYKTWVVEEASIVREGQPTLVYNVGQPIQNNFDPSKISFVFSANNTYQGTDEKGKPESGQWLIDGTLNKLKIVTTTAADSFDIIQLTRTNLDFKNDESVGDLVATVTLKMVPKK